MTQNKISIIIPTLQKNKDILYLLLDNLETDKVVKEIIVIDNSLEGLDYIGSKIKVIIPNENLYVNPSWNLGVKEAQEDFIGLLNDDIIIPQKFCSNILSKISPNTGIIGINTDCIKSIDKIQKAPQLNNFILDSINYRCFGFGICMFLRKNNYYEIPNEIKIMYGDEWLFFYNKKNNYTNFSVKNQTIYHIGSLSSSNKILLPIIKQDGKIYKKLTIKWYNRLFSFEELENFYKFRFLGITFKLRKYYKLK